MSLLRTWEGPGNHPERADRCPAYGPQRLLGFKTRRVTSRTAFRHLLPPAGRQYGEVRVLGGISGLEQGLVSEGLPEKKPRVLTGSNVRQR
jgi:hypothetical protein